MLIPAPQLDDLVKMIKLPTANVESLLQSAYTRGVQAAKEIKKDEILELIEGSATNMKQPILSGEKISRECTWCGKPATRQTARGESNQRAGGLPVNDGWFCHKCWDKGEQEEKEAMYG